MTRVAAIDCGTNSIRLLVAEANRETGEIKDLDRRMKIVRLGQDVDRTGRLAPEALERTFAACREYAEVIRELGAEKVRFVATSASRDAENRAEFVRGVRDVLGVEPEVISGDDEAEFSFTGATKELAGRDDLDQPYLVVDIGGGSTEFVVGSQHAHPSPTTTLNGGPSGRGQVSSPTTTLNGGPSGRGQVPSPTTLNGGPSGRGHVFAARSVDIGCVRMTERHLVRDGRVSDPPTPDQIAAMRADIAAALDLAAETVPLERARTLVGLAGSVTTVAAIALGLREYDSSAIHHSRIGIDQVREITGRLLASTHAERAAIPVLHPGRVDVIGAGALVLLMIMERVGAEQVVVSEHDILDGIAWSVL
ncbi:exopolyphosphatase [Streptantibioticus rubrisoli]|uniref:Ppx/GppA family phosphatase n=1 Tax=Streptantibioticus rubrisoli TaxID=1387313 RepID=A0ABT1PJF7_9ACTN|nr:Ppx/GppA family phosphatase [Streptantibioticus rubrisoli]